MRNDRTWQRRAADVGLVLLLIVTVVLVRRALDAAPEAAVLATDGPTNGPTASAAPSAGLPTGVPAPVAPQGLSLETVDASTAFRIETGQPCGAGAVTLERTRDGGRTWDSRFTPLHRVAGVAFLSRTQGFAAGLGAGCLPELHRTDDAGDTWTPLPYEGEEPVGIDAAADGGWLLLRATGVTATGSRVLRTVDRFATLRGVVDPCTDGPAAAAPTAITATSGRAATVVCAAAPRPEGQPRLLLSTSDGGGSWAELAGARRVGPDDGGRRDGLDGDGVVRALDATAGGRLYAVLGGAGCPEGQLRRSADAGRNWTAVPCLAPRQPVDELVAVSFTSASDGWLVAMRGPALVTLRSADGGRTWTPAV